VRVHPTLTPTPGVEPLWVGNEADGNVLVIDAHSNLVVTVIPSGITPSQVVVGEGAAWVLDKVSDKLAKIDLDSHQIQALIPISKGQADALAVGDGGVWVGVTEPPGTPVLNPFEDYEPQGGVLRIDPASNAVTGYAQTGPVLNLATGRGVLWVLAKGKVDTPIQKVDPRTLTVASVELAGTRDWLLDDSLAAGPDSLWLYSQAFGKLYRTSYSGHLYAEVSFGQEKPQGPASILINDDEVWVGTPWGVVARVDPAKGTIASQLDVGAPVSELKSAGGAIWAVSPISGAVYRIDPVANQVTARVDTGSKAAPTPWITPTPIQRATHPCDPGPFSRLSVGLRAYTLKDPPLPQRLHKEAGKDKDRAGWIQPGETVKVLEGPVCADGWVWWRVETEIGHNIGWAAEGDENGYWLNPLRK
jgi:hypothetical protein